jgi:hypothetical protein
LLQQPLQSPSESELQLWLVLWQGAFSEWHPSALEKTLTACNSLWQKCSLKVNPVVLRSTKKARMICRSLAAKIIIEMQIYVIFVFDALYNSGFKLHNVEAKLRIWGF